MEVTRSRWVGGLIRRPVASGRYGDAAATVEEAPRVLDERERWATLRAAPDTGCERWERGARVP